LLLYLSPLWEKNTNLKTPQRELNYSVYIPNTCVLPYWPSLLQAAQNNLVNDFENLYVYYQERRQSMLSPFVLQLAHLSNIQCEVKRYVHMGILPDEEFEDFGNPLYTYYDHSGY